MPSMNPSVGIVLSRAWLSTAVSSFVIDSFSNIHKCTSFLSFRALRKQGES
jgi:hypothetical protein